MNIRITLMLILFPFGFSSECAGETQRESQNFERRIEAAGGREILCDTAMHAIVRRQADALARIFDSLWFGSPNSKSAESSVSHLQAAFDSFGYGTDVDVPTRVGMSIVRSEVWYHYRIRYRKAGAVRLKYSECKISRGDDGYAKVSFSFSFDDDVLADIAERSRRNQPRASRPGEI
ncbi:MAG: hypothetical protein HY059_11875 [Proteobacteria bacterium]|nr:hypothetical protein [Pseudomonadota bacterium]